MLIRTICLISAMFLSPAYAEPVKITCEYSDPYTSESKKLQFTIDPVEGKLANSFVSETPTIPAFAVWNDFWFFHNSVERNGEFASESVIIHRRSAFWLLRFSDQDGMDNDGALMISGNCTPPIPRS